jgi:hypothetical protein
MTTCMRSVQKLLPARPADVAGATVLRALPRRELRRVGPFVFIDQFQPPPGGAAAPMHVPAHPHHGLQTVTYLYQGAVRHRDSLGSVQVIEPGAVNWMTAGKGIVHAEDDVPGAPPARGLQTWVALPPALREVDPAFEHLAAADVPEFVQPGARVRVLAGRQGSREAPVKTFSEVVYLDVQLEAWAKLELPVEPGHDLAVYPTEGQVLVGGTMVEEGVLAHLEPGDGLLELSCMARPCRAVVLGGAPLAEPTVIWWNYIVASVAEGRAREQEWREGRVPFTLPD